MKRLRCDKREGRSNVNDHFLPLKTSLISIGASFFGRSSVGIGTAALSSLLSAEGWAANSEPLAHNTPSAKRVIYLFQSGAPSQIDLLDHKPALERWHGEELPDNIRQGQRLTTMTGNQASLPLTRSHFRFRKVGQSGAMISDALPFLQNIVDDCCFIRSMHTEAINHDPAITFFVTGAEMPGRPSLGAWLSYGLGSESRDLPAFVVMLSRGTGRPNAQPLYDRLWGTGFLPTNHQGVKFRPGGEPVLFLNNPQGTSREQRRRLLYDLERMNRIEYARTADPEIITRIRQYEMAYRLQASVPRLTDLSDEPQYILDMYGPDVAKKGTYAYNCLLARRMAERGVRFIQLFSSGMGSA